MESTSIKVIARVKPLPEEEEAEEGTEGRCVHVSSGRDISVRAGGGLFNDRRFRLDAVLDGGAQQSDVFAHIVPLMQNAMAGFNCTVFMYGQTGSGKHNDTYVPLLAVPLLHLTRASVNRQDAHHAGL
jgi:kinesin family protein 11